MDNRNSLNIEDETVRQMIDTSSTNASLYSAEINPNIRFIGEKNYNIVIPKTPFQLTNDVWITIDSLNLTSNDDNFGINIHCVP